MEIDFPDLRSGAALRLLACGAIETGRRDLIDWLAQRRSMIATYSRGKHKHFVRLLTGGKAKHFHLEVVVAAGFPKNRQPSTTANISEVQAAAERVMGEKIDLRVSAEFHLPFDRLSETGPIRVLSAQTQAGGTSIQLTAGVLTLTGSRVYQIAWQQLADGLVSVTLRANIESVVASSYLGSALEAMERFHTVLVLGQPSEAVQQ